MWPRASKLTIAVNLQSLRDAWMADSASRGRPIYAVSARRIFEAV
jgi:hypothetical protein